MTLLKETNLMKKTAPLLALFLVTSFPMSRAGTKEEVIRLQRLTCSSSRIRS